MRKYFMQIQVILEREVHHKLHSCRVNNNKEFFQNSLEEAKEVINLIGKKYDSNESNN